MSTCDTQEVLSDASCFSCYPEGQLDLMRTEILCGILTALNPMATCSPAILLEAAACWLCYKNQLPLIQTQLLCEIREAIGNGQQTCFDCGTTDPVDPPACNCALYDKRYPDGTHEIWFWDVDFSVWVPTAGGPPA